MQIRFNGNLSQNLIFTILPSYQNLRFDLARTRTTELLDNKIDKLDSWSKISNLVIFIVDNPKSIFF